MKSRKEVDVKYNSDKNYAQVSGMTEKAQKISPPLVSVVTPVYNTESYLKECIESVLKQTYQKFEYIIVNNCSTDRSGEIAEEFAKNDSRIRIQHYSQHLDQLENYNRALELISPASKYCKIVQADDIIYPDCIKEMVDVAADNPTVGIVGAYYLAGRNVQGDGLPFPSFVTSGRLVCRMQLMEGYFFFGTPTSILIRSDIIRNNMPFYDVSALHADTEACYRVLKDHDFGFVQT